jgi:hypothetical protein
MTIFIVITWLIFSEAIYEGLKANKLHIASEIIEFIYHTILYFIVIGFLCGIIPARPVNKEFVYVLIGAVLYRYAIFDFVYNISSGADDLFYIGNTKLFDKLFSWFFTKTKFPKASFLFITRFIALLWGISWIFELRLGIL